MTRDDILRMAREAGGHPSHNPNLWDIWNISEKNLECFAALVAASERQACVDIAEDEIKRAKPVYSPTADITLRRIRERGQL